MATCGTVACGIRSIFLVDGRHEKDVCKTVGWCILYQILNYYRHIIILVIIIFHYGENSSSGVTSILEANDMNATSSSCINPSKCVNSVLFVGQLIV